MKEDKYGAQKPATAVATQSELHKEEIAALINEIKSLGGPDESICKMIEE